MLNVVAAGNLGDVFLICIKLLQYSRSLASTIDIVHIHGPTAKTKQLDQLYKFVLLGRFEGIDLRFVEAKNNEEIKQKIYRLSSVHKRLLFTPKYDFGRSSEKVEFDSDPITFNDDLYRPWLKRIQKSVPRELGQRFKGKIGIQLQSGSIGGNLKTLSITSICEIAAENKNTPFVLFLPPDGQFDLRKLSNSKNIEIVKNLSFKNWIEAIFNLDALISPEGLPAFLAMASGTPTICIYRQPYITDRIYASWRTHSLLIQTNCLKSVLSKTLIFKEKNGVAI